MNGPTRHLPCPFCGSSHVEQTLGVRADGLPWPYIECKGCMACAEVPMWNQRKANTSAEVGRCSGLERCPTPGSALLDSRQRILDAAYRWAQHRNLGATPAKDAWLTLMQQIDAELSHALSAGRHRLEVVEPKPADPGSAEATEANVDLAWLRQAHQLATNLSEHAYGTKARARARTALDEHLRKRAAGSIPTPT